MTERWIKSYERLLEWEWTDDPYIFTFWVKLLLLVNIKDKRWHGRTIKRGQLLTSMRHMEELFGWSHHTIQRILENLQSTGEIKVESSNEGTLITVVNFSKYQGNGVANTATPSATQPATNIRNIEREESKKEENIYNPLPHARAKDLGIERFGSFYNVYLHPSEHRTLIENYGKDMTDQAIEDLGCKLAEGDEQALASRNHYATLDRWLRYQRDKGTKPTMRSQEPTDPFAIQERDLRTAWRATSEKGRQEYLDTHDGLLPWEYERRQQQQNQQP